MIQFSHVYKNYPGSGNILKDLNFKIGAGEFVFLTGPSGAGKTTLFKLLSAYEPCSSGQIKVFDNDLDQLARREIPYFRRKIGVVYQDFKLLKDMTVAENIGLPLKVLGFKAKEISARVNQVIDMVGLLNKADYYPDELSGGEQQRVCIARAIVHRPTMVIADEPTGNLDPALSDKIIKVFEKISREGTTVLIATHDHSLVEKSNKKHLRLSEGVITWA